MCVVVSTVHAGNCLTYTLFLASFSVGRECLPPIN